MRAGVAALALALLAASCGGSEAGAPPSPSSTISTTVPATTSSVTTTLPTLTLAPTSAAPTTTIDPTSTSIICGSADPLLEPDLDGDGEPEQVHLVDRGDGQALYICDGPIVNDRSFDLAYGHWYVAVTDVEPDGTDELFIGARDFFDGPGAPATSLHWVDVSGDDIVIHADGGRELTVGPTTGGGCVDLDADGDRELVGYLRHDSGDGMVVTRRVSSARPPEDPIVGQGELIVPDSAKSRALVGGFTCGDEAVDLLLVEPPLAICEADDADFHTIVDIDGDGLDDLVAQGRLDHGPLLRGRGHGSPTVLACLADGRVDELPYGGMGEVFGVALGPDGAPFVWTGGTTVSAAFTVPVYWRDDRLAFLEDGDAETIGFTDGFPAADPVDGVVRRSGCGDADGDGTLEFVQVSATPTDVLRWERRAWSVADGVATLAWTDAATRDLPADGDTWRSLADLVPDDCRFIG